MANNEVGVHLNIIEPYTQVFMETFNGSITRLYSNIYDTFGEFRINPMVFEDV